MVVPALFAALLLMVAVYKVFGSKSAAGWKEIVAPVWVDVPATFVMPCFSVSFDFAAASMVTLNTAATEVFNGIPVALLTGPVDNTVGRTPGSVSLSQPERVATKSNAISESILMVTEKLNNFIFICF